MREEEQLHDAGHVDELEHVPVGGNVGDGALDGSVGGVEGGPVLSPRMPLPLDDSSRDMKTDSDDAAVDVVGIPRMRDGASGAWSS